MKGKLKRFGIVLAMVIALTGSLCSCEKDKDNEVSEVQEDTIEIGMCFDTFVVERWERDRDVFVSTANELGAQVDVQNPNGQVEEQINQLEYFIDKGVDVIVVVPIEADSLTDVINKARNKGIKVISYDRLVNDVEVDLYLSFDNYACGTCMGNGLAGKISTGDNVMMICGPQTDGNVELVAEGFKQRMDELGLVVADETYLSEWKSELAYEYVEEHIDLIKDKKIKAIMCGNDNLASQVIYALSENMLAGDVLVIGQDGDLDACQRIVEGTQYSTVYKPVDLLANQAAISAVDLAKGKEVVYDELIDNGACQIPYIKLSPENVTKENMEDTIIKDNFHSHEEIYINVKE